MVSRNISHGDLVKASMWYTVSSFLAKGIGYLTVPIFARLLTKAQMGDYSNLLVWNEILTVITGISIESSINRARLDFPGKLDEYCSTILVFTTMIAGVAYGIAFIFMDTFESMLSMGPFYVHLIFAHFLISHAYSILLARQRVQYRYKISVALSLGYSIVSTSSAIVLIFLMQDKLMARTLGHFAPQMMICIPAYIYLVSKGRKFDWSYCKYAFLFCWPFVPHLLSMRILHASDRVMITKMVGSEANATYTIANNCVSLATLFMTSLNAAISPWVFDKLYEKDYQALKKITFPYVMIVVLLIQMVQLLAPEVLLIIGGKKYLDAMDCFLPLFSGVVVHFCYTMYVNVEQFSRKTWAIAVGTVIAAIVNVVLNLILIPQYGYIAAAYTTLIGYIVLFLIHYAFVRLIGYRNIYNDKSVFGLMAYALCMQPLIHVLYGYRYLRYAIVLAVLGGAAFMAYKNREQLRVLLKKKKKPAVPVPEEEDVE